MKKIVTLLLIFSGAAYVVLGFLPPHSTSPFDFAAFGRLPVQYGTRVLPIDSVARNTLRLLFDRTDLNSENVPATDAWPEGINMSALQWFVETTMRPETGERLPVFRINSDDVLGLLGRNRELGLQQNIPVTVDGKTKMVQSQANSSLVSYSELIPHLDDIEKAATAAEDKKQDEKPLSAFDLEIIRLAENLKTYRSLLVSLVPPGDQPVKDWEIWQASLKPGMDALNAEETGKPYDQNAFNDFTLQAKEFADISTIANVGIIPVPDGQWLNLGNAAVAALKSGQESPILPHYGEVGVALRANDPVAFNAAIASLTKDLDLPDTMPKVRFEAFVNNLEPFFRGALLYLFAFLCACVSWMCWGPELRRAALWLVVIGFAIHTFGLGSRVYLTGYGVVTSLYSSALFVGWVAVMFGLVLEVWKKNSIGAAVAAFVGFATLVVAHNLPFNGDDLELPQAVLASNLWLWTHVKCITFGYGAMFVAGTLGVGYILAGMFSSKFTAPKARELASLTYGVTCFATLFSFVGTMLGGIWADQSWGRFWGWDPKENGALLIVLWCAICLHARWGKLVSERGQMALAVGGNIVTGWSWFGVNLLGVGLHSYGFMQGTFVALVTFWITQLIIISFVFLPEAAWRSRQGVKRVTTVATSDLGPIGGQLKDKPAGT